MKYFLAALLIVAVAVTAVSFQGVRAANSESVSATYSHGTLHVTIPYNLSHSGTGQLTVEVLDPEDQVLGRSQRQVEGNAGKGLWQEDLKLAKSIPVEDLVCHRLRYGFAYRDWNEVPMHAPESLSRVLRTPGIHGFDRQ